LPERGTGSGPGGGTGPGAGFGRGAANAGPAAKLAADAARKDRRLQRVMMRMMAGGATTLARKDGRRGKSLAEHRIGLCRFDASSTSAASEDTMLDAAAKALSQMFSPPFRSILFKSAGLALALIVVVGIALHRVLVWFASYGETWAEGVLGSGAHTTLVVIAWILSIAAGLGILVGSIMLMPAVTALVGSLFVDDIALEVERTHYPNEAPGTALPIARAVIEGVKFALLAVLVYLIALPFLLFAGAGLVIFFVATAYLLGRQYFELAAMRFHPVPEAKALRKAHQSAAFTAGLFIAAFVSIPIVNLATPLFAMAMMVHVYKRVMAEQNAVTARR
jgi:CysZ protein